VWKEQVQATVDRHRHTHYRFRGDRHVRVILFSVFCSHLTRGRSLVAQLTSFLGIGLLSLVHFSFTARSQYTLLLGSFGATAVLVFDAPAAPFSQPRNVIGGHIIGAAAGVVAQQWVTIPMGVSSVGGPLGVALAIVGMAATGTTHPPAGGTALIVSAVLEGELPKLEGWQVVVTAAVGAALLVVAATLLNNVLPKRRFPHVWT
jgi:CBS domain-containing membrane protein